MAKTQVWYDIVIDTFECEFEPLAGMHRSKRAALQELQEQRQAHPSAYLCRVVFTKVEDHLNPLHAV